MANNKLIEIFKEKSRDELIDELIELSDRFWTVNDYFESKYNLNSKNVIIKKFKIQINDVLYPDHEFKGGFDVELLDQILTKFKTITTKLNWQIDLELYALETGNNCAIQFGGSFGEEYYEYFEELFEDTLLKYVKRNNTIDRKIETIIKNAFEGYGHKDKLEELYENWK